MKEGKYKVFLLLFLFLIFVAIALYYFLFTMIPKYPNIILIGVDTLRADHLGCYGYKRSTSPNIDKIAMQGVLFENCIAPIPRTTQSVASIMTGRYPKNHGVRKIRQFLPEQETTIAEVLQHFGYETISVQANGILEEVMDQGFQKISTYPWKTQQKNKSNGWTATQTTDRAIALLKEIDKQAPYFLWVFYFDPHMGYEPPEVFFDRDYQDRFSHAITYGEAAETIIMNNRMTPREREHAIALYDSEIKYTDAQIGRLLASLPDNGRENILILTSDHGESLGERDYYFAHGECLNNPNLHVPLIIKGIDFSKKRVRKIVRPIDIFPTLSAHLSIDINNAEFDGVNLRNISTAPMDIL